MAVWSHGSIPPVIRRGRVKWRDEWRLEALCSCVKPLKSFLFCSVVCTCTNVNLVEVKTQGIFGVPLRQSITYANVAISLIDEQGQSYIYGYVPIVVAKCGVFLKEKGGCTLSRYLNITDQRGSHWRRGHLPIERLRETHKGAQDRI